MTLVLIKGYSSSYKNVHAILRVPNTLKEYYIVQVNNLQDFLEKNLDVITDFPSNYEIIPYLYEEYCSVHKCPIEYDADEMYCLEAGDDLSHCSIQKRIVFQSKPFDTNSVVTRSHPLVQQILNNKRQEELLEQKIIKLQKVLEKYQVYDSDFRYYIIKRGKERILLHTFIRERDEYKLAIYYYKNAVFLIVMHDPHFYDDVGYFKMFIIRKDESVEKEYNEWKEEQEFYENWRRFVSLNEKILRDIEVQKNKQILEQKVNDIVSKFKQLSNNIEIRTYIYENLGEASIYTSLKGYVNKQIFNKYLELNKQLKAQYNPKSKQWFISVNL